MAGVRSVGALRRPEERGSKFARVAVVLALAWAGAAGWLALAAAPAHAYIAWNHDSTTCASCHPSESSTSCTACHTGFQNPPQALNGSQPQCWTCHEPGQSTASLSSSSADCSQTCHLFSELTRTYSVPFSHGTTPHLGADWEPCLVCHEVSQSATDANGSPHHDGLAHPAPTCQACHNDVIATAEVSHGGEDCTACHGNTMSQPDPTNAFCLSCHASTQHPEAVQIAYTSTANCTSCHGIFSIHSSNPLSGVSNCTTCHTPHYQNLGSCTTCHANPASYHHTGAKAIPLAQCTTCHNGTIAKKMAVHDGLSSCSACHDGMNVPPTPATCTTCHSAATYGTSDCATCHGGGTAGGKQFPVDQIHSATPNAHTCTTCHTGYQKHAGYVPCKVCHTRTTAFHHGLTNSPGFKQCTVCHRMTHAGRRLALSTCASCHKGAAPKANPAVQHSSKITKLSRCSTCHSRIQVHAKAKRASMTCRSCHTGAFHRRMPLPTSSTCLKCHASARAHAVGYPCVLCHKSAVHNANPTAGIH